MTIGQITLNIQNLQNDCQIQQIVLVIFELHNDVQKGITKCENKLKSPRKFFEYF